MDTYEVTVEGRMHLTVGADSDEDAMKKAKEMLSMHVYGIDLDGMKIKEARYFAWDCLTSYDLFSYVLSDSWGDNRLADEIEKDKQKRESLEEMTGVLTRDVLSRKQMIDELLEAVINGRASEEKYRLLQKIYGYLDEEVYDTLLKMEEGCEAPGGADERQVSGTDKTTANASN